MPDALTPVPADASARSSARPTTRARSSSSRRPRRRRLRLPAGSVPDPAAAARRTARSARCYSLCSSPHVDEHAAHRGEAGPRRRRLELDQRHARASATRSSACRRAGCSRPSRFDDDLLLFAGGSGITPVLSILKSALAAGSGAGRARLRQPARERRSSSPRSCASWPRSTPTGCTSCTGSSRCRGCPAARCSRRSSRRTRPTPRSSAGRARSWRRSPTRCATAACRRRASTSSGSSRWPRTRSTMPVAAHRAPTTAATTTALARRPRRRDPRASTGRGRPSCSTSCSSKGVKAPYSCRQGVCSACACILDEGEVKMLHNEILEQEDLDEGYVLGCQSRAAHRHGQDPVLLTRLARRRSRRTALSARPGRRTRGRCRRIRRRASRRARCTPAAARHRARRCRGRRPTRRRRRAATAVARVTCARAAVERRAPPSTGRPRRRRCSRCAPRRQAGLGDGDLAAGATCIDRGLLAAAVRPPRTSRRSARARAAPGSGCSDGLLVPDHARRPAPPPARPALTSLPRRSSSRPVAAGGVR